MELVPQGTLIERIRAGGHGLGGILTQTGIGTPVEDGKQRHRASTARAICSKSRSAPTSRWCRRFSPTISAICSYALTARNFNPVIAMAADTVIVSADNIVPVGVISPDHVVTPAPLVDYLVANS